jgi:hypothetical protein
MFEVGFVYNAEQLNGLARLYWRKFAKRAYFDQDGMFITIIMSIPLMFLNMFIAV